MSTVDMTGTDITE